MHSVMATAASVRGGVPAHDMFPVKTRQWRQEVNGHPTEFVLFLFANCIFAIVTQLDKLGTIVRTIPLARTNFFYFYYDDDDFSDSKSIFILFLCFI